jgi:hypothetical protein
MIKSNPTIPDYYLNVNQHYSKVKTPDELYNIALERYKNNDKEGLEKISCPSFGSPKSDFNVGWFTSFYKDLKQYDFSGSTMTIDTNYRYFDIQNVIFNNEKRNIKLYYSEIFPQVILPVSNYYCIDANIITL